MLYEILRKAEGLVAGELQYRAACTIQFASGDRLIGTEPSIYFPGGSAEGTPPLSPFFDGFVFISKFAPDQERDLSSSLLQRQYLWPGDIVGALKRSSRV
jgi:hypothetical protein